MRELRCPDDSRRWQVWAVQSAGFLRPAAGATAGTINTTAMVATTGGNAAGGSATGGSATGGALTERRERRQCERRVTPVETEIYYWRRAHADGARGRG